MRGELETEQNCNILTPTLLAITAFLSRSPGLLKRGPGAQPLLGHVSHSSIFSPTDWLPVAPGLYNCSKPTYFLWASHLHSIQLVDNQVYPLISSTGCTCYLHRCISYFDSSAGGQYVTLGTILKGSVKGVEDLQTRGQLETIQTSVLLRRVRGICCHSHSSERPSAKAGVKNSQEESVLEN